MLCVALACVNVRRGFMGGNVDYINVDCILPAFVTRRC